MRQQGIDLNQTQEQSMKLFSNEFGIKFTKLNIEKKAELVPSALNRHDPSTKNSSTISKSSMVPSFENCLGLSIINSSTFPDHSDESDGESIAAFERGQEIKINNAKGSKRKEKQLYKQINCIKALDKVIDEAYIRQKEEELIDALVHNNYDSSKCIYHNYYFTYFKGERVPLLLGLRINLCL